MTPKEKAEEIFNKYYDFKWLVNSGRKLITKELSCEAAKQCALIAVDEILDLEYKTQGTMTFLTHGDCDYWKEVKQEIEKL